MKKSTIAIQTLTDLELPTTVSDESVVVGTDDGTYLDGDLIEAAPVPGEAILDLGTGGVALLLKPNVLDR